MTGLRGPGFSAYDNNDGFDIIFANGYRVAVFFSKKTLSETARYMDKTTKIIKDPPVADVRVFDSTGITIYTEAGSRIKDATPETVSEIMYMIGKQPANTPKEHIRNIIIGYLK